MKARSTPYALKPWAMIAYFTLLALTALAFLGWTQPGLRIVDVEVLVPGFYAHTSNLLLACTLVLVFGLVRLWLTSRELAGEGILRMIGQRSLCPIFRNTRRARSWALLKEMPQTSDRVV